MLVCSKRKLFVFFIMLINLSGLTFAFADDPSDQNPFQQLQKRDTLKINLQEAILTALEHNPSLSIQRLQPKIAKTIVKEQGAIFDPTISASASKTKTKQQRFLGSRPDPFELISDRSQYDVGILQNLPTGTTISANASISASLSSIYTDQFSGNVGITVTQALLQGFGLGTNLASLRQAKLDFEISKAELKGAGEEIIANVEKAYWDLYLTNEEINIQGRSLELANKQLKESQERVAVGKLPSAGRTCSTRGEFWRFWEGIYQITRGLGTRGFPYLLTKWSPRGPLRRELRPVWRPRRSRC